MMALTAAYPGVEEFDTFSWSALRAWLYALRAVDAPCNDVSRLVIEKVMCRVQAYATALATIDRLMEAAGIRYVPF